MAHGVAWTTRLEACRDAAMSRGRFERIDSRGRAQQELFGQDTMRASRNGKRNPMAANVDGFSVEAGVCFGALDRKGREKLIRYCLRPAIADERLSILRDGSIACRVKYPRGKRTHLVMRPIEFMARVASIVAPPRSPLMGYHGVLAANSPLRRLVVPLRDRPSEPCATVPCDASRQPPNAPKPYKTRRNDPKRSGDASLLCCTRPPVQPAPPESAKRSWRPSTSYIPWAELIRRSFDFDVLDCPRCHGRMKPVAVITRREVIDRILSSLTLPLQPEPLGRGDSFGCDVTGEPIADWVVGVDPDPEPDERGPPSEAYCIDPPAFVR